MVGEHSCVTGHTVLDGAAGDWSLMVHLSTTKSHLSYSVENSGILTFKFKSH